MTVELLKFFLVNLVMNYAIAEASNLRMVTVIYRHGDRAPVTTFPTDKYNVSTWPLGWGQLTNIGKNQMFELGKWIRATYSDFLPTEYNEKDIHVVSTNISRALMSAYLVLAGLYEPTGRDIWREDIHWQPIPVRVLEQTKYDYDRREAPKCQRYVQLMCELLGSEEIVNVSLKYAQVFKNLSDLSGLEISGTNFSAASRITSTFIVQEIHGLELPSWASEYYPQPLKEIRSFKFQLPAYNEPMKRLKCGPLLKTILGQFDKKINGSLTEKMLQFSAHDTTVAYLMMCLNVYDLEVPPYSSILIFELHEQDGQHFVALSYRKNKKLHVLQVPGCDKLCPLDDLKRLMTQVLPGAWEDECKLLH